MVEAYPLAWPPEWPRTPSHKRQNSKDRFRRTGRYMASHSPCWSFAEARDALYAEVSRLGGQSPVLSTNFPTDRHGIPVEKGRRPDDNGVAIYFVLNGKPTVMACDIHIRAEENMRSLALSIDALRALARHGGGMMMERAFQGFAQLEAPGAKHWSAILGIPKSAGAAAINEAYRSLSRERHPDTGGSAAMMAELNAARAAALRECRS